MLKAGVRNIYLSNCIASFRTYLYSGGQPSEFSLRRKEKKKKTIRIKVDGRNEGLFNLSSWHVPL